MYAKLEFISTQKKMHQQKGGIEDTMGLVVHRLYPYPVITTDHTDSAKTALFHLKTCMAELGGGEP